MPLGRDGRLTPPPGTYPQELAYAFQENKPVVPVIMDQVAWNLLTTPRGADEVLEDPACGLADYLGKPLLEGQPLSADSLCELYWQLSAINFCPCREEDVANMGLVEVVRNLRSYIIKDIPYLKVRPHSRLHLVRDASAIAMRLFRTK